MNPLKIQALDVVLFKGVEFVSKLIMRLEKRHLGEGQWSHVGLIVNKTILDHPNMKDDELYIWESTMSGCLSMDKIPNIDGKTFFGVQLRPYTEVIDAVVKAGGSYEVRHLKLDMEREFYKQPFTTIFNSLNGTTYDGNLFSLLSALYPKLRFLRKPIEYILGTEKWLFCSELVALVYKELGIISSNVNPKNVVPQDFVNDCDEDENGIPAARLFL